MGMSVPVSGPTYIPPVRTFAALAYSRCREEVTMFDAILDILLELIDAIVFKPISAILDAILRR
jgi:hypothetical protein